MEELNITVDENKIEVGVREIIKRIRSGWTDESKLKVSAYKSSI